MNKKLVALFIVITMIMTLVGCSSPSDDGSTSSTSDSDQTEENVQSSDGAPLEIHIAKRVKTDQAYVEGETVDDNYLLNYVEDQLNVEFIFDYEFDVDSHDERINLLITGGDIPDVFVCNRSQLSSLIEADMIQGINESYEQNVSDNLRQAYDNSEGLAWMDAEKDGVKWALPSIDCGEGAMQLLWIRTDWMDKFGLEEPKTLDDVRNIALTFKNGDPDGDGADNTLGIVGSNQYYNPSGEAGSFNPVFSMVNSFPEYWYYGDDGELLYGSIQPETKEALQIMQDLVADGVVEKEFASFGWDEIVEALTSGKSGMVWAPWWYAGTLKQITLDDPSIIWQSYFAPLNDEGIYSSTYCDVSGLFLVFRKGVEKEIVDACIKTANIQWELDQDQGVSIMPEPESPYAFSMMPLNMNFNRLYDKRIKAKEVYDAYNGDLDPAVLTGEALETYDAYKYIMENGYDTASLRQIHLVYHFMVAVLPMVLEEDMTNWVKPATFASTPTKDEKWATLEKLETETFTQIILGQKSIDEFDDFVDQWLSLGGQQIIDEYKAMLEK